MPARASPGRTRRRASSGLLRLFHNATSLGGVESLAEQRRMSEGPGSAVPDDLVRFSVGIEAAEDPIADIEQAFDRLST